MKDISTSGETYSPINHDGATGKILIAGLRLNLKLHTIDISGAFLMTDLTYEIHMRAQSEVTLPPAKVIGIVLCINSRKLPSYFRNFLPVL